MKIHLSNKLKELRQKRGDTQEALAAFLGISAQAVSKWERNEGYPDITLLPRIAGYYHISVDELLGVDAIAKEERIREITEEYSKIRHHVPLDPSYHLDEGIERIRRALKELPGVFFFEQLLASDLLWKGKTAAEEEKKVLYDEARVLCEDILERCTEQRWRNCANEILLVIYADLGMTEQALQLAYQMPGPFCTCEYMLTYILKEQDLIKRYKMNAVLYYKVFRESILKLNDAKIKSQDMLNEKELSVQGIELDEYMQVINTVLKYQ